MNRTFSIVLTLATISPAAAQQRFPATQPPAPLPPSISDPQSMSGLSLIRFDVTRLALQSVKGHWQLWADRQLVKDLGPTEREATEVFRLVRDLGFTQYGTIPGAIPPFEFWLADGEGARGGLVVKNVIPFDARSLKAERVTGAWVVHDGKKLLYNFGNQEEAARQALGVMKKYGFNQMGVVGAPRPVMTYLTVDPYGHAGPVAPEKSDSREILSKISQQGLTLPKVGFVGGRTPIEFRKLEATKAQGEWVLAHGKDVLARYGHDSSSAREAQRVLQDARVTEVCLVGKTALPVFLSSGQAPRYAALGSSATRIHPGKMKAQAVNNVWCITEGARVHLEFGDNRADAELVLKVLQHFQFDQVVNLGHPAKGGIRFYVKSR